VEAHAQADPEAGARGAGVIDRLYHRFYLWAQKRQSWAKREKDPAFRTKRHIAQFEDADRGPWPWPSPILCLGPRNGLELDYLEQASTREVVGLDLFSSDPRIRVGDMHAMPFADNAFGLIWASHVLEHAHHPGQVLDEIERVLRPGGYVFAAWPTGFKTNWHDRWDYGLDIFAANAGRQRVHWAIISHRQTGNEVAVLYKP
jgi:SAM-dependent methyltransferase